MPERFERDKAGKALICHWQLVSASFSIAAISGNKRDSLANDYYPMQMFPVICLMI